MRDTKRDEEKGRRRKRTWPGGSYLLVFKLPMLRVAVAKLKKDKWTSSGVWMTQTETIGRSWRIKVARSDLIFRRRTKSHSFLRVLFLTVVYTEYKQRLVLEEMRNPSFKCKLMNIDIKFRSELFHRLQNLAINQISSYRSED